MSSLIFGGFDPSKFDMLIAYDASNRPEYVGLAPAGAPSNAATWMIRKISYSGDNAVSVRHAGGDGRFMHVWDDRATYGYPS